MRAPPSPLPHEAPQEPKPAEKTGPSRRTIITWSALMFTALTLAWFVGAVVRPVWRVRGPCAAVDRFWIGFRFPRGDWTQQAEKEIAYLGGPEDAAQRLSTYLRLPNRAEHHRTAAAWMLGECGRIAVHPLTALLKDKYWEVRYVSAVALGELKDDSSVEGLAEALDDRPVCAVSPLSSGIGRTTVLKAVCSAVGLRRSGPGRKLVQCFRATDSESFGNDDRAEFIDRLIEVIDDDKVVKTAKGGHLLLGHA